MVSQLSSYQNNQIEVVTSTLPRNTDIDNGYGSMEVGRGSVSRIDFNVIKVRRVLLDARFPDGSPVPKGASVFDKDGNYLTTAVDDGSIFLSDVGTQPLFVNLPGGNECSLTFELPEDADSTRYFENATATCTRTR